MNNAVNAENPSDLSFGSPTPETPLPPSSPLPQCPSTVIKNICDLSPRSFHVAHLNCESLMRNFHEFRETFSPLQLHVLCVSETWLKNSIPNSLINIPNYVLLRNDRLGKSAGGVAVYLRSDLKATVLSHSPNQYTAQTEYMILEVTVNHQRILLSVVYRPPKANFDNFEEDITPLLPRYQHILILGDLNFNLLNNKPDTQRFRNLITSLNLNILPLNATYHSGNTESWLDVILTNNISRIVNHGQVRAPDVSPKHDIIFTTYSLKMPKYRPRMISYRDIKNINEEELEDEARRLPFHTVIDIPTVEEKLHLLNSLVLNLYDKVAPVKTRRVTRPPSPWMTNELLALMSQRNIAFSKYRKASKENLPSIDALFEAYRKLRNRCTQEVRRAKFKYACSMQDPSLQPKQLWNKLRMLGISKKTSEVLVGDISLNELNGKFCEVKTIDNTVRNETINYITSRHSHQANEPKFYFRTVHTRDVYKAINNIKSNSQGVDNIPINLIRKILPFIIHSITDIFNSSLRSRTFPALWKLAHITPIPKTQNPTSASDYRPISILPALSKSLEYIVHHQITDFLSHNNYLNPFQSGFRPNHSTRTALIQVTDDIREAMDNRLLTLLVLLDFSKAFQMVDHKIMLAKLSHFYNFSSGPVQWMKSYLDGRLQRVKISNEQSDWKLLNSGVPQGSVLGPLLFSLYINDLPTATMESLKHHMYADDLQCYSTFTPSLLPRAIETTNCELKRIFEWSSRHGLQINPQKSQCIIIGSRQLLSRIDSQVIPPVSLNGVCIPFSTSVKNLGVFFNETLTWNDHINFICKKAYAALHPLYKLRNTIPPAIKERLVHSLVLSHLDYCDIVYDDCDTLQANKLQRIQNTCIRYIYNLKRYDHLSQYFQKLSWLQLKKRRQLHRLTQVFKTTSSGLPSYISRRLLPLSSSHPRYTRSSITNLLFIPLHKSQFFDKSFTVAAAREWNSLPPDLKTSRSVGIFKRKLKEFLSNQYNHFIPKITFR